MSLTKFSRPSDWDLYFNSEEDRFEKLRRDSLQRASMQEWMRERECMHREYIQQQIEIERTKLDIYRAKLATFETHLPTKGLRGTAFVTLGQPGTSKTERPSTFFKNLADGLTREWS